MKLTLDLSSLADYEVFLRIKALPAYSFTGRQAWFPDEYAGLVNREARAPRKRVEYRPISCLFDYQADIARMAIEKGKFAVFADCGLGKTLILTEFARHAQQALGPSRRVLIVSPLMVVRQTMEAVCQFYKPGEFEFGIEPVAARDLTRWIEQTGSAIGITNYEALADETPQGRLGALILDESSMLKSHYGKHGQQCLRLGAGLDWKLCCSGTPAPNDRIEYANHAVFLDAFPTVNSFLARFFVNRGQTQERWEIKPHAIAPFYRALSHWSIFLTNPATYGWRDNTENVPPIHVHIDDVELTREQQSLAYANNGTLFAMDPGGITSRSVLGQIAKGNHKGKEIDSLKPAYIKSLVDSWPDESTIIWCMYNAEQESLERTFPDAASITGATPLEERFILLDWFQGNICDCEKDRRLACVRSKRTRNTCGSTTQPTRIGGSEADHNRMPSIDGNESGTPPAPSSKQRPVPMQGDGRKRIQKADSPSDSKPTESLRTSSGPSWNHKEEFAPSAAVQNPTSDAPVSTSIIATSPGKSEDCSASTAITSSEKPATIQNGSNKLPHICGCIKHRKTRGRVLLSKPKVLGFGLNLQVATRQIFSGLQDSYESFYQAVKRSNRYGSTRPLNVHIPVTEIERPMIETVLRKAARVQHDTEVQEQIFKSQSHFERKTNAVA